MTDKIIFDAFGTLFNLDPDLLAEIDVPQRIEILNYTREKQLSYTWLFSLMDNYESFEQITFRALKDALKKFEVPTSLLESFAQLYMQPVVFDDVLSCLQTMKSIDKTTGILSNGTRHMLDKGIAHNKLGSLIDHVFSVEEIRIFKPHPSVYEMVCQHLDCVPKEITFVSSNQWDIAGANRFGFQTIWVNRSGQFRESIITDSSIEEVDSLLSIH